MDIFNQDYQTLLESYLVPWSVNLVTAILIFIVGRWVAKGIVKWLRTRLEKSSMENTLVNFISNILYATLFVAIIITALNQLGVNTTSLVAVFAAASLAIGLALKDSLSNFASGVMLVLFRPFKQGDFVEAGGTMGVVEQVNIFSTIMRTPDNREITVPNSQIFTNTITNNSARDTRRIDLVLGISYDDDIRQAKALFEEVIKAEPRILEEPATFIGVMELADSSVSFAIRPWVNAADFWNVRCDLLEKLKIACDEQGITIPYPQRDVHVYTEPEKN